MFAPRRWPIGSIPEFKASPHRFPAEHAWAHGGVGGFHMFGRRAFAIADPALAREVLVSRMEEFPRSFHYRSLALVLGDGLLTTDGPAWAARRRAMQPMFRNEALGSVVEATQIALSALFSSWDIAVRNGQPVPAMGETSAMAMRVVARALLSGGVSDDAAARTAAVTRDAAFLIRRRNTSLLHFPEWAPIPLHRAIRRTRLVMEQTIASAMAEAAAQTPASAARGMLATMLASTDAPAAITELKQLFAAGYETTAMGLTWALQLLAGHREWQERLRAETRAALQGRRATTADVPRLPLARAVAEEALRLYPPVFNVVRQARGAGSLGPATLRAGDLIFISIWGLHRHPALWNAPDEFRPERFLDRATLPAHAFIPFASGGHVCLGAAFALTEMTVALAEIISRYVINPDAGGFVPPIGRTTLAPEREVHLLLSAAA